jgi:hypothetical protein
MRMIMHVIMPNYKFNEAIRDGSAEKKMGRIFEEIKPEAVYFTNYDGKRGVIVILNVEDPSKVPSLAEPFFLYFDAEVHFHIVMSPQELAKAGLEALNKKWA